jgi:hypothetical protein
MQILWPDGIFMTKHPNRKTPPPPSGERNNGVGNYLSDEQRLEAARRANFVRELIIGEYDTSFYYFSSIICSHNASFLLFGLNVFLTKCGASKPFHCNKPTCSACLMGIVVLLK